jgi:hypothetical protein
VRFRWPLADQKDGFRRFNSAAVGRTLRIHVGHCPRSTSISGPTNDSDLKHQLRRNGAVFIAVGYTAWLIIPIVVASDLRPSIKSVLDLSGRSHP